MTPALHPDEARRLAILHAFEILDTDPEAPFDDVVKLAAALCDTPVAVISLVDADRQWFKARHGLDLPGTPRDQSICAHAILQEDDDLLEIRDCRQDPRTADNPLVTGPDRLRFYAGVVLRSSEGAPLGTLCVLDRRPGQLTALQRDALRVLAAQVIAQMELKRALSQAKLMRREVDHRVKNSLQSVSALTRMQARSTENEDTRLALLQVGRRIETVAALHEQLYRADQAETISLARFGPSVCKLIGQSAPPQIALSASEWPEAALDPSVAAALGVILNEFASNAIKHAFPDGRAGQISCRVDPPVEGRCTLTLADNGVGLPEGVTAKQGLGMQVIEASARQLGGTFALASGPEGTTITLDFPLQVAEAAPGD
ncbi:sensor histidine kinase [Pseudooceanicola sp. 200-1SW]|uniref:sensor histidine kinase n=1 Tax=Pseudooceanicola sp. 200-1SW TaxID=3425949 RepID=UPI003D7FD3C3